MQYVVAILFLISFIGEIKASPIEPIVFDTTDLGTRIAFSYTRDMVYDHQGYLWIATHRGLYQVDGSSAYLHVYNPNDSFSLANNVVQRLFVDEEGILWVLTDKSIQYYDYDTRTFNAVLSDYIDKYFDQLYKISFTSIIGIDTDVLLIGTKDGAITFDKRTGVYASMPVIENLRSGRFGFFDMVHNDRDNKTYLFTSEGIYEYDIQNNKLTILYFDDQARFDRLTPPFQTLSWHQGHLYFMVRDHLYIYNINRDSVEILPLIGDDQILPRDMEWLNDRYLLISTADDGMYIFDVVNRAIHHQIPRGTYNQLAVDHRGRLVTITETQILIKSRDRIAQLPTFGKSSVVFTGLQFNEKPAEMSTKLEGGYWHLRDYERSISVQVAKTSPLDPTSVVYEYQLDNGTWSTVDSTRRITIKNLSSGNHSIAYRAIEEEVVLYGEAIKVLIDKYFYEQWWFRILVLLTISLLGYTIFSLISARKRDVLYLENQVIERELHALRAQMNPHFIFNTLNSIKNYVLTKSPDDAADYLTRFSKLMRMILENSKADTLTLKQELSVLSLYIEMEQRRLSYGFQYKLTVDPSIDQLHFKVAPLLLQPFVENAIWHGLLQEDGERKLQIEFVQSDADVICTISDNGIGRTASKAMKAGRPSTHQSHGIAITKERLAHINRLYNMNASISIKDADPVGTVVTILLPFIK